MITLENYISANGKYPERLKHKELTEDIKKNAVALLEKVNNLLNDLGIKEIRVSSGWRPSEVNAKIPNAAKKSLHMQGLAVDMEDVDGKLDDLLEKNDKLLKKYGLWQESPAETKSWSHVDCKDRGIRAKNQFIP